jgi:hypothetical protein
MPHRKVRVLDGIKSGMRSGRLGKSIPGRLFCGKACATECISMAERTILLELWQRETEEVHGLE